MDYQQVTCPSSFGLFFGFFSLNAYVSVLRGVGEEQRERKRERIPGRLRTVSTEPDTGLEPTNREIMT